MMGEMSNLVIIAFGILFFSWLLFYLIFSKRHKLFVKSFLDSNNNILIVYSKHSIIMINQAGLDFFGYNTFKEFRDEHSCISNFFLEEDDCYDKYTDGKKWVEKIEKTKSKSVKVKILSKIDKLYHYFDIKVSKMKFSNQYLLTFNNISKIENERQEIERLLEYDPLTQVYNRVKINKVFKEIIYAANGQQNSFSVILLDIDFFKKINDTYGHNVGDKVLIELARLVKMILRKEDVFARWGGEEFLIMSEKTSLQSAKMLAEYIRREIERFSFDVVKDVTCSFGVTEFQVGDTQHKIFERVDLALYEAKENGRNQVVAK